MKTLNDKKERISRKKKPIRLLIADDHSVVREGLVSLVKRKSDIVVVAEASNGREAVDLWKQHSPDVTLVDLRMPELDGMGAIKEIRGVVRVLMYSLRANPYRKAADLLRFFSFVPRGLS